MAVKKTPKRTPKPKAEPKTPKTEEPTPEIKDNHVHDGVPCSPMCVGHVNSPCEKCGRQWPQETPEVKAPEPAPDEPTAITIMVTPDEKRIIKTAMKALGITDASEYVHSCLREASINYAKRPFSASFCKLRKRSILGTGGKEG